MKQIEIGGKSFAVHELTRKEVKQWRKMIMNGEELIKSNRDHMDAYLEVCLSPDDLPMLEDLTQKEFQSLYDQAHALTFGDKEKEKN